MKKIALIVLLGLITGLIYTAFNSTEVQRTTCTVCNFTEGERKFDSAYERLSPEPDFVPLDGK